MAPALIRAWGKIQICAVLYLFFLDLSCFVNGSHPPMAALGDTQDDDSPDRGTGGGGEMEGGRDLLVPSEIISNMSFRLDGMLPAP